MSLILSRMEEADISRQTEISSAAYFSTSGISGLLFNGPPSKESLEKITENRKRKFRNDPSAHYLKITDVGKGEMVACARWNIYEHERTEEEVEDGVTIKDDELIPEFNVPVHRALFEPIQRGHKEVMGTRPHVYLTQMMTHPAYERKGAGGMLLQWGLDKADELDFETFLEATPAGKSLYEKFGFEVVKDIPFDLAQFGGEGVVHHVCMLRKAQASGKDNKRG